MDPVIFAASRVAHLSAQDLPPLADYDAAEYLREKIRKVQYCVYPAVSWPSLREIIARTELQSTGSKNQAPTYLLDSSEAS